MESKGLLTNKCFALSMSSSTTPCCHNSYGKTPGTNSLVGLNSFNCDFDFEKAEANVRMLTKEEKFLKGCTRRAPQVSRLHAYVEDLEGQEA
jgi:hypothetical protein